VQSKTEIQYPENAQKLEANRNYKLIVAVDEERTSEMESGPGLGFSVLSSKERKVVLDHQNQLERLGLGDGPTQYLIAHLFASYGLHAEAIQKLESISKTFETPANERFLAELYMTVELPRQAERRYLKSLELSQKEQDDDGQLECRLALADIYLKVFGNPSEAREHLEAAIAIAGKVGDDATTSQARKKVSELN
jgi:tetratricopeptide (TPR) repeat protein